MRAVLASLMMIPAIASAGVPTPVIGGSDAPQGAWPDCAGIIYNGNSDPVNNTLCSGVLIAPTVVLTAGHCVPGVEGDIGDLTGVLIGTASLADVPSGELLNGSDGDISEYPNSQSTIDIGIIKLETPAKETPRAIATGWAKFDIANGAKVEIVGFGSIDMNGNTYIPQQQQAQTTITDYDCTTSNGCYPGAQPDGELGAGGMGVDTCPGDSGGPLYLLTDYGTFLAGNTSRGYSSDVYACSEGGIYARPDKIVDYIEMKTGVKVTHGPEPTADPISVVPGGPGETTISANDPKSSDHHYDITTPPANGMAAVDGGGQVRVCEDPTATAPDSVTITVTDSNNANRVVPITIPITPTSGEAPASCDVHAFSGGCCDAGGDPSGALAIALCVGIALVRRRRRS